MEKLLIETLDNCVNACNDFRKWLEENNFYRNDSLLLDNCSRICLLGKYLKETNSPILLKYLIVCEDAGKMAIDCAEKYRRTPVSTTCIDMAGKVRMVCKEFRQKRMSEILPA
jgi:hypothetical protein